MSELRMHNEDQINEAINSSKQSEIVVIEKTKTTESNQT